VISDVRRWRRSACVHLALRSRRVRPSIRGRLGRLRRAGNGEGNAQLGNIARMEVDEKQQPVKRRREPIRALTPVRAVQTPKLR
jgi:hypothetical protein